MTTPFDMAAWDREHPWPTRPEDTELLGSPTRKGAVMQAYHRQYADAVAARQHALVTALFAHYAPDYPLTLSVVSAAAAMLTRLWGASSTPPKPWGQQPADSLAQWLVGQAEHLIAYTVAVHAAAQKETDPMTTEIPETPDFPPYADRQPGQRIIRRSYPDRPDRYWLHAPTPPEGRYVIMVSARLDGKDIEVEVGCDDHAQGLAREAELFALQDAGGPLTQAPLPDYAAAVVGRDDATLVACHGLWRKGGPVATTEVPAS